MKSLKLLAILALVIFFAGAERNDGYKVGDTARDFKLKNVDGKMVSMSDYKDAKGFVVIFTCNTCPWSMLYEDRIIELHNKFASEGFPVIAINPNDEERQPDDSFDKMVEMAKDKGYPFPYVQDETQEIARAYGATNTPHVYVLNKDRKVVYIGAIDNSPRDASAADKFYVEDAIEAIKKNQEPEVDKTKAIGCTIKWAS